MEENRQKVGKQKIRFDVKLQELVNFIHSMQYLMHSIGVSIKSKTKKKQRRKQKRANILLCRLQVCCLSLESVEGLSEVSIALRGLDAL